MTGFNNDLLPVLTSSNTGVWICAPSNGVVAFPNDYFGLLGLTPPVSPPVSLDTMLAQFHRDDIVLIEAALASASAGETSTIKYRCIHNGSDIATLEGSFMPCAGGVAVLTVNKERFSKLLGWEKRYTTLVDSLFPNFIFVFDVNFFFVDVITPTGLRLFHKNEELIGTSGRDLYTPEVSELFIANIRECLRTNHWREIEYHLDLYDIRYYYQARIVPVDGDKAFCLIQDIGDRVRRLEEILTQRKRAEESDRMKSVFLAGISHEIRTPLNAIVGLSELLMEEEDPEAREAYAESIRSSNNQLLQIVTDILDLSRLEADMDEFVFEETDVKPLITELVKSYIPGMKPGVQLLSELPEGELKVPTDAKRLRRVLVNFLSNAVKYTEKGSIMLKVEKGDDFLVFLVSDTGCGIPGDKLNAIFKRFEKLNQFTRGTGLGLAICKTIVERLGGEIGVESKLGEGSVFSFTIPYRHIAPGRETIGSVRELAGNLRKRILVVEPADQEMQFIYESLKDKYNVVGITEEEKIVSSFILEHPNIVLISMEMIGKQDVVRKIHNISSTIPIIAMATSDFYHDMRWAIENGCTDVISKPFSARKLEEVIAAFIV